MKKNEIEPLKITSMDIQPISDEELRALVGGDVQAYASEVCDCYFGSDLWVCRNSD